MHHKNRNISNMSGKREKNCYASLMILASKQNQPMAELLIPSSSTIFPLALDPTFCERATCVWESGHRHIWLFPFLFSCRFFFFLNESSSCMSLVHSEDIPILLISQTGAVLWSASFVLNPISNIISVSEWAPSHEVGGTASRAQRQGSIKPQIWGRLQQHFCCTGGSWDLHHFEKEAVCNSLFPHLWPNWAIWGKGS